MSTGKRFNLKKYFRGFNLVLLLSILVHFSLLLFKVDLFDSKDVSSAPKEKRMKINLRNFKQKKDKMQIVDTSQKKNKKKPDQAKFLGKSDQKFDRETIASKIGSFKTAGKGTKSGVKKPVVQNKPKRIIKTKKLLKKSSKKVTLADLSFDPSKSKKIEKKKSQIASLGLKNGDIKSLGLSQSSDYVDDIPMGDMTQLNTIEYKYYGFYHRIKQKLEQYWGNSLRNKAETLAKAGRRIPSSIDKITSLKITIDDKGNIIDIFVKSTSGIKELDDAAVESFNRAGPFPNPPSGMMTNGKASIEWGFVVKG